MFVFAFVALFLIASCDSAPAANSTPNPQVSPSPTAIPEEYSDLSNLLQARVAKGDLTLEEGLVSALQLVAGETAGEDFLANAQMTSPEATGVILQAQNYVQTGSDEGAKTEIRRLLSALSPSKETLDLYSAPAGQSRGRSPGHSAQVDCRTLQHEGFPADHATQCFLRYEEVMPGGSLLNIYFPEAWDSDEVRRQYLEPTRQAVADSVRAYDGLGLSHHTFYVFFTLLEYIPVGTAYDLTYASAELALPTAPITNCKVAIYPSGASAATGRGFEVYKQVLAHEIFHCYQFWNYNEATTAVPYSENDWWMEGTAEYFGNYVYPPANAEYEYLPSFDRRSPFDSIIDMDYENFLLFQYLANEIGNVGILRLIASMPDSAGENQADALSAFPDIEELFHDFGRQYIDGGIMDTGGGAVPGRPRLDGIVFDESTVDAIPPVDRFILQRFKLIFSQEHHFDLEVGSEGEGSQAVEMGGAGTWEPFASIEFDVSCGNREMVLLTTTTEPSAYHLLLDVLVEDGPVCDECLIGLWQLDNDSYEAYWNATPAGEAEGVTYNGVSGVMWGSFSIDGEAKHGWTDFKISYTQSISGIPEQDVAIILNGTGRAAYLVFGDTLSYSDSVSNFGVEVVMNGRVVGSTGISPEDVGGGFTTGPYQYVCTEDTLQFISFEFPQINELIFLRAE